MRQQKKAKDGEIVFWLALNIYPATQIQIEVMLQMFVSVLACFSLHLLKSIQEFCEMKELDNLTKDWN